MSVCQLSEHEVPFVSKLQNEATIFDVINFNNGDDPACSHDTAATIPHSNPHSVATTLLKRRMSVATQ